MCYRGFVKRLKDMRKVKVEQRAMKRMKHDTVGKLTAYQQWIKAGGSSSFLRMRRLRSRTLPKRLAERPYLFERKERSDFNIVAFLMMAVCVFYIGKYLTSQFGRKFWFGEGEVIGEATKMAMTPKGVELPTGTKIPTQEIKVVLTVQVSYPTDAAPATMTPTVTEVPLVFLYSYYDPDLGGVNCLTWDEVLGCVSTLASGDDYRLWWDRAVACPVKYDLGTIFKVVNPQVLRGRYVCLDRYDEALYTSQYLDFLSKRQLLPWNEEITVEVILP